MITVLKMLLDILNMSYIAVTMYSCKV